MQVWWAVLAAATLLVRSTSSSRIVELDVLARVAIILEASFDFAIVLGSHLDPEFCHEADIFQQEDFGSVHGPRCAPDAMTFLITGATNLDRDVVVHCLTGAEMDRPAFGQFDGCRAGTTDFCAAGTLRLLAEQFISPNAIAATATPLRQVFKPNTLPPCRLNERASILALFVGSIANAWLALTVNHNIQPFAQSPEGLKRELDQMGEGCALATKIEAVFRSGQTWTSATRNALTPALSRWERGRGHARQICRIQNKTLAEA